MAKQDRKRINMAIALVASVVLAVGLVPVPAIAVGTGDELGGLASEASPAAATPDAVPLTQGDEGTASDEQPAKAESPAFAQSATVDGVTVTVEADAGVFPEGARLSVAGATSSVTEAAVSTERETGANVAASYTFDIKVLDADGEEIQPADGKTVRVSFKAAEVADPNLDVSVYHVPESGAADALGVDVTGATATAETDGFSYYTVEFTYGELQYVLKGGEKVPLADVLAAVGLSGEATGVEVSNSERFSASKESGGWVITSHEAFSSDEWMRVTIAGRAYEIKVTDSQVEGDYTYDVYDSGTANAHAEIEGYSGAGGAIAIPSELGGVPVKIIGAYAFKDCKGLTSVTIPASVTSIYDRAFNDCTSLASVTIQEGVTTIGDSSFRGCSSLASVTIPASVTSIENEAFYDCASSMAVYYAGTPGQMDAWQKAGRIPQNATVHYMYTVTWKQDDGAVIDTTKVEQGKVPTHADPTKAADSKYTYTFVGWTPEIVAATGEATYTANYGKTLNKYKVTFVDEDGTVLKAATEYDYGTKAADIEKPSDPTKKADAQYSYTFAGWSPEIADVTADATYKATYSKTAKAGSYEAASGDGSTWTKGSTDPITLTFKRATDDERTFDLFKGVEVDGKAVPEKDASGKANWTAKKGSLILSLQPSYLETLSTGKHTVTAVFDDGSASATFTVEAKASPTPASGTTKGTSTSASPKTGDETGGTVVVLSVTAGAALCLALFALSQRKRRKPAHAGKHARR